MRILFISTWFPWPLDTGSRLRVYYLLKSLAERHTVHLVSFLAPEEDELFAQTLHSWGISLDLVRGSPFRRDPRRAVFGVLSTRPRDRFATYSKPMARQVVAAVHQERFDLVISSSTQGAPYALLVPGVPRLCEEHNFMTSWMKEIFRSQQKPLRRLARWFTWQKCRRYERGLFAKFDAITMVSERDRQALERSVPPVAGRVTVIPNGVDTARNRPGLADPQPDTLVFNGALTYYANADAMRYFLAEIFSVIRTAVPRLCMQITGRHDGVDLKGLSIGDGVMLTGYLDDVRPVVSGSWACVVPLRIGGGTRLKILEAMALGTPVISTSKGAEGLAVSHEQDILIADEPAEFARQTVRVLKDRVLRERLAANARRLVEANYGWQQIGQAFCQVAEQTAARGAR